MLRVITQLTYKLKAPPQPSLVPPQVLLGPLAGRPILLVQRPLAGAEVGRRRRRVVRRVRDDRVVGLLVGGGDEGGLVQAVLRVGGGRVLVQHGRLAVVQRARVALVRGGRRVQRVAVLVHGQGHRDRLAVLGNTFNTNSDQEGILHIFSFFRVNSDLTLPSLTSYQLTKLIIIIIEKLAKAEKSFWQCSQKTKSVRPILRT